MRVLFLFMMSLVMMAGAVMAQPEVQVGKIDPIQIIWGPQTIYAEISSMVDYPKFISASVRIAFTGRYLNPKRVYRSNFVLEPSVTVAMPIKLEIPPNFGEAKITIELYDVIDTLDPYFADQKITEQHSRLLFTVPDELFGYMQERITMPPFTDNSPLFDSEVDRLAFLMMREGKRLPEIASLTKIDSAYLSQLTWKWKYYQFLAIARADSSLRPAFPFITLPEAGEIKPIADKLAEQLAAQIERNMGGFVKVRDSLIAAGSLTRDSNNVLHGGTVLYKPYPVVNALLLWYSLGRGFISGSGVIDFYQETEPCNTLISAWMYAVVGGEHFNGHQHASFSVQYGNPVIQFADTIPVIRCPEQYPYLDRLQPSEWTYTPTGGPEFFAFDTTLIHPALKALGRDTDKMLQTAYADLRTVVEKYEPGAFVAGVRWWFWNLVSTRTNEILLDKKVITRYGNGHYRLEVIKL